MNRKEEWMDLMVELEWTTPDLKESIQKGSRRKARKKFLYQPLVGIMGLFMVFVLSVNLCMPVAMACSKIPGLRELTKAVAFSKSLRTALEHEYAQEVYMTQTKDGVTIEITSMIVDQDRLTVFYRVTTELEGVVIDCSVPEDAEDNLYGSTYVHNTSLEARTSFEEMQYVSVDFLGEMTDVLPLCMTVWDMEAYQADVQSGVTEESNDLMGWYVPARQYEITSFLFELDLDLAQIPETKTYDVNRTIELGGQVYTITNIEVHPTYMDINMLPDESNTASLVYLHFYVENEKGEVFFDTGSGRIAGVDREETFRGIAESSYFYEGELTKIVVTGAEWLEYEKESTYINLATGVAEDLPENITLKEIKEADGAYDLTFEMQYLRQMDRTTGEQYGMKFWMVPFDSCHDETGKQYYCETGYHIETDEEYRLVGEGGKYTLRLENYPYEEVWLENHYSSVWYPEEAVSVILK